MTARLVTPQRRGFLHMDSHPAGCAQSVRHMLSEATPEVVPSGAPGNAPVALVVGSSAGYGLAAVLTGLAQVGVRGIGVCLEKGPTHRRTGTAGWYRTAATAALARQHGRDWVFVNGDAFSDAVKTQVCDLVRERFGRLDYLIYSLAAPRRTDPDTGVVYSSVLRPIGEEYRTRTLKLGDDGPQVDDVLVPPAQPEDIAATVAVMGGSDWDRWVSCLGREGLLADGFSTAALSYVGSPLTSGIYRSGTIGAAKAHLEATAHHLQDRLAKLCGGLAITSVNGAAVTQSSAAIPGVGLYLGLLRGVLGEQMVSPIGQLRLLWDQLTGAAPLETDSEARIRLDGWELDGIVQASVVHRWDAVSPDTVDQLADLEWFQSEVSRLYGFAVSGVDYEQPTEVDVPWPDSARWEHA